MEKNEERSVTLSPGLSPTKPIKAQQRRVTRRSFIRNGLIVSGAVAASFYVKPDFQSIRVPRAFAAVTRPPRPPIPRGCTPGYWRQPQHFDDWPAGYSPSQSFTSVFPAGAGYSRLASKTLLQALEEGGGDEEALGRHAVAALLNAAHPDVQFLYSEAEVKGIVNSALTGGDPGNIESTKNLLEAANEAGCFA